MSEIKEKKTANKKTNPDGTASAAKKKKSTSAKKETSVKEEKAAKPKRMTKEEKAAYEREQARLAAEKAERDLERKAIKDEMIIIVSIAIAILLVLSNFRIESNVERQWTINNNIYVI